MGEAEIGRPPGVGRDPLNDLIQAREVGGEVRGEDRLAELLMRGAEPGGPINPGHEGLIGMREVDVRDEWRAVVADGEDGDALHALPGFQIRAGRMRRD